jgi:hypothetical protein
VVQQALRLAEQQALRLAEQPQQADRQGRPRPVALEGQRRATAEQREPRQAWQARAGRPVLPRGPAATAALPERAEQPV